MSLLDRVESPADLRSLDQSQLEQVVSDVRDRHIEVVASKGGHFGASLGVAELTVALHYVFDTPRAQLVWDTGHQGYIHKVLTGRNELLPTIRTYRGLAPFLKRDESEYDSFGAGHAATSISAAWGMAVGRDLNGDDFDVVAVIGDGAMGCGLAYEALNNAGHTERDFIVVLNDNEMSIAPAVGALNKYLTGVMTSQIYDRVRNIIRGVLRRTPATLGDAMEEIGGRLEESVKHVFGPGMLFEELGFRYVGPVDGHNVRDLVNTFKRVQRMRGPILVHALTRKGKGYALAEGDPWTWHASGPFDRSTGRKGGGGSGADELPRYQKIFGRGLIELADRDDKVVGITAAMPDGTSTDIFQKAHPDRFFDVGIAEAHGVTFAAGLATRGIKPVVAIYSTFLQRAFDSIVHDVALQRLPVVFGMDRAGIAGADGPTHHGAFDIAYMLAVPGMTVTAPRDGSEMLALLRLALDTNDGPWSVRWPRDRIPAPVPPLDEIPELEPYSWEIVRTGSRCALLTVGTMVEIGIEVATALEGEGIDCTVVNCRFLKPYDRDALIEIATDHEFVATIEEGTVANGFGAFILKEMAGLPIAGVPRTMSLGLPDYFLDHGSREELLAEIGLDAAGIVDALKPGLVAAEPVGLATG